MRRGELGFETSECKHRTHALPEISIGFPCTEKKGKPFFAHEALKVK